MSYGNAQLDHMVNAHHAAQFPHEDVEVLGRFLLEKYADNQMFSLFSGNSQIDGHYICYLSVYNPITEQDDFYHLTRTGYGHLVPWVGGKYLTLGAVFVPLLRRRKLRLLLDE